jgi:hypothetical protein
MNKEFIEKLSAIREDLLAFQAQAADVKKLAELVRQKMPWADVPNQDPMMFRNYQELWPYMTVVQKSRAFCLVFSLAALADCYLQTGKDLLAPLMNEGHSSDAR